MKYQEKKEEESKNMNPAMPHLPHHGDRVGA